MGASDFHIVRKKDWMTKRWTGGETTQLFIYPPQAHYEKKDFLFRVSTASIESERSVFTPLPGYQRWLMVLNGQLDIRHKNHHRVLVKPFEVDFFNGAWHTESVGIGRDFNLMLDEKHSGHLSYHVKEAEEVWMPAMADYQGVFVHKGAFQIERGASAALLKEGDFVCWEKSDLEPPVLFFSKVSSVVFVEVNLE